MIAHIGHWTTGSWILLTAFLALLGIGVALALVAGRGRTSGRARAVLDERPAHGDISPVEYRERLGMLGPKPRRRLTTVASALVAVGLLGSIVFGATAGSGFMHRMMPGMSSMMGSGETARSAPAPSAGAREVRVTSSEFSFRPAEFRVAAGETVNVVLDNQGMMFHTLTIGELGFDLRANGSDSIAGALRAERAGTYSFICVVSGHVDAGMRGTLVVG